MEQLRQVKLPSGAMLEIGLAPFAVSKGLYQAVLKELRSVTLDMTKPITDLYKDLFCLGYSSPDIEHWLKQCFVRCLYNAGGVKGKIDDSTFEPADRRQDYPIVCMEVAKENIAPFAKALFAEYKTQLDTVGVKWESSSTTTP